MSGSGQGPGSPTARRDKTDLRAGSPRDQTPIGSDGPQNQAATGSDPGSERQQNRAATGSDYPRPNQPSSRAPPIITATPSIAAPAASAAARRTTACRASPAGRPGPDGGWGSGRHGIQTTPESDRPEDGATPGSAYSRSAHCPGLTPAAPSTAAPSAARRRIACRAPPADWPGPGDGCGRNPRCPRPRP